MNTIAGIGVALKETSTGKFKKYAKQIVKNAEVLAKELLSYDFDLVGGGTNTHLLLIDLQNKGLIGNLAAEGLEKAGIVLNRNSVPFDPNPPFYPSGIRLGTPGITSRGMKEKEMKEIAKWICEIINELVEVKHKLKISFKEEKLSKNRKKIIQKTKSIKKVQKQVEKLCKNFLIKMEY